MLSDLTVQPAQVNATLRAVERFGLADTRVQPSVVLDSYFAPLVSPFSSTSPRATLPRWQFVRVSLKNLIHVTVDTQEKVLAKHKTLKFLVSI